MKDLKKKYQSLHNNQEYEDACDLYSSLIKNDNEVKKKFDLYDLNKYINNPNKFVDQVKLAKNEIELRKNQKGLRRANKKLSDGDSILKVFKNNNCTIVSPLSPESSNKAAYLDGESANWCIAAKDNSEYYWDLYFLNKNCPSVFYIYTNGNKYALVFDKFTSYLLAKKGIVSKPFYSQIEDRNNNSGDKGLDFQQEKQEQIYKKLLDESGLSSNELISIISSFIKNHYTSDGVDFLQEIFYIIQRNKHSILNRAIRCGVDINATDQAGRTSLMFAVENNREECVDILLKNKANPEIKNKNTGKSSLQIAILKKNPKIIKMLLEKSNDIKSLDKNTLDILIKSGDNDEIIKMLIDKGYDVNSQNALKETPLMTSIKFEHFNIANLLLNNEALINIKDKLGRTALMFASYIGNNELVKRLLSLGANKNDRDIQGKTALDYARRFKDTSAILASA